MLLMAEEGRGGEGERRRGGEKERERGKRGREEGREGGGNLQLHREMICLFSALNMATVNN